MLQTFLLASVFTYVGNHISPQFSVHAQEIKNKALKKNSINQEIWFKGNDHIINAKRMITDKHLENIEIININAGSINSVINAEVATYDTNWVLKGTHYAHAPDVSGQNNYGIDLLHGYY